MSLIRKVVRLGLAFLIFLFVLYIANFTLNSFLDSIQFKNPVEVYNPLVVKVQSNLGVEITAGQFSSKVNAGREIEVGNNKKDTEKEKPKTEKPEVKKPEITTGVTKKDIEELVSNIEVLEKTPTEKYARDDFEKPVARYEYKGKKYSRNKYAAITSKYLVSEDPFKYNCPYSGIEVTKARELDYDHIVPLKACYDGGAYKWSKEKKNKFAYDQHVGVNVLYKYNRAKGAKTPSEWLPDINRENYCYTYLKICEKYNIAMKQKDIDVCKLQCLNYISAGKQLEFME